MLASRLPKTVSYPMMNVPVLLRTSLVMAICMFMQTVKAELVLDKSSLAALNTLVTNADEVDVAKYIDAFLKHPSTTEALLSRGNLYFPIIEKELSMQGLPDALKVLPIIESRFDPMAISRMGAAGLWQFMAATAREMGLRIDSYVDERRDPAKATRAALSYLNYLYIKYGDWSLAFAAYNAGPGRVNKAIRMAGGQTSFAVIKAFLPKETRDYIPKYIAAQYILQNHKDLGLRPQSPELDLLWTGTVLLSHEMSIAQIAEMVGIPNEVLIALNPGLKRQYVPQLPQGYDLILPKRVVPTFQYFLDTSERPGVSFAYRTVEMMVDKRSSIFELAGSLKVDPYLLKAWNQLTDEFIDSGDRIVIHELYDPSQVFSETIVPMPFTNLKDKVNQLPEVIDYRRILYDLVAKQRVRQDEARNWSMHLR